MAEAKKLIVLVSNCNVKKLDLKAYGISKQQSIVKVKVNDKVVTTTVGEGLDPTWEQEFEFEITDPDTTKCSASFWMGAEADRKQVGDEQEYLINTLVQNKPTYKAIIVPGGKVEMMFTAKGFGKEDVIEVGGAFMDILGDDEGGMIMDDE